jgi:hypothetical protein
MNIPVFFSFFFKKKLIAVCLFPTLLVFACIFQLQGGFISSYKPPMYIDSGDTTAVPEVQPPVNGASLTGASAKAIKTKAGAAAGIAAAPDTNWPYFW